MAYTKLFSSIVTSTIWMAPDHTRLVWITMLALADKNGEVQGSVPGLARLSGVSVEKCREALKELMSPDEESRTKVLDGIRVQQIDGGWELVNHAKYRALASKEDTLERTKMRVRRHRERKQDVTPGNALVTVANAEVTPNRDIAEADAQASKTLGKRSAVASPTSDADLIKALAGNPAYAGIDISREFYRMKAWCDANGKMPSKRRFVNWLNRTDQPMVAPPVTLARATPVTPLPEDRAAIQRLMQQDFDLPPPVAINK